MGIDELVDDVEDTTENKKVRELIMKLGVENEEELEQLDDRLSSMIVLVSQMDNHLEQLEERVEVVESLVAREVKRDDQTTSNNTDDGTNTADNSDGTNDAVDGEDNGFNW